MEARKIKEWHLDPELLQRLATGGTIDISSVMSDYLKKTDVIRKAQLDDAIFTEITNDINAVQSLLDNYRKKQNQITAADLDTELTHRLEELETKINTVLAESGTSVDIEALVNEAVAAQLTNSVSETVNSVLDPAIDEALDAKLAPAINNLFSDQLNDTINSSVQTALHNSEAIDSMQNTVLQMQDDVDRVLQLQDEVNDQLVDHETRISHNESVLETDVRKVADPIAEEDLSEALTNKLNQITQNINALQNRGYANPVYGDNKSYIRLQNNNLVASDIIRILDIVTTAEELNEQQNLFEEDIYDIDARKHYYLDLLEWNEDSRESSDYTYQNATLTSAYVATENIDLQYANNTVSGTNASAIDPAVVTFGFYGTRFKIAAAGTGQAFDVVIDNEKRYSQVTDLNIARLSEGPHRVDMIVLPGASFAIDANVSIDDTNAVLMQKADIRPAAFYERNMYDTIDYLTDTNTYDAYKSANVRPITPSMYQEEDIDLSEFDKDILYSSANNTLFYCVDNQYYVLTENSDMEAMSAEEALAGTETTAKAITAKVLHDIATTIVEAAVAELVHSAPETLDTLSELAAALGNNPNFATTIATQIGNKADADHTHNYAGSASVGGPASAVARETSATPTNSARSIWFSQASDATKLAYDEGFTYNPSTDNLTVSKINGVTLGSSPVFTDTKNTAGSTSSTSKLFLIGATSQTASSQTYSHVNVYETNGALHANSLDINGNIVVNGTEGTNYIQLPSGIQLF